ncbi:uroplakin-3a isoform X1 [Meles meles]|uniref:uroplakin-3a isoform X1 n=1 Tax=Meles meles TaxID=9662 RepID=UPI001E69E9D5|nr:uroplakin-3a isoform X1 [Meles meles]
MPPLWALLALGCLRLGVGVNLQPQLASVTFATNNPTLTTVALEKPLCMFDSPAALGGTYEIYLYVLVDLASSRNASVQDDSRTPLSSTFQQTEGGRTGPYKAVAFDLSPCSDLPSLDALGDVARASEILNAYLVRVQVRPCQHVHGLGTGPDPVVRPHPHQPAHPILSDRHVARPEKRRHDHHHVHLGLPALLPARRLCRGCRPQPFGHGQLGQGNDTRLPDHAGGRPQVPGDLGGCVHVCEPGAAAGPGRGVHQQAPGLNPGSTPGRPHCPDWPYPRGQWGVGRWGVCAQQVLTP